jgi:serine protease Do
MLRYFRFIVVALILLGLGQSLQAEDAWYKNTDNFPPVKVAKNSSDTLVTVESLSLPLSGFSILDPYQKTIAQMGGTGFIVRSDGYILTSPRVVKDAKTLTVKHNGKEYKAEVKVIDEFYDLALLKIDAKNLPAVEWGDSSLVAVGAPVVVVGAPEGLEKTLTYGIVSNIRDFRIIGPHGVDGMLIQNGIVTDSALHEGVESAPAFDSNSKLIAVVSRKAGGKSNIGYMLPSNLVKRIVDQMIEYGKVCHPWLGIFPYGSYDRQLALYMGIPIDEVDPETGKVYDVVGVLVDFVAETSPAAIAGLARGDLILKADGVMLHTVKDLEDIILNKGCGENVELVIIRNFGLRYQTIEIGNKQKDYESIYMMGGRVSL